MNLTDKELDALAERLFDAWDAAHSGNEYWWRAVAREAARWADEQQGEVVWEMSMSGPSVGWYPAKQPTYWEANGHPVRAIRVIATTTKEGV